MSVQIAFSQHHRQVLVERDVLHQVKYSLSNGGKKHLNESGVDVPCLLEQSLVSPVWIQSSQFQSHPIVLSVAIFLVLIITFIIITITIREGLKKCFFGESFPKCGLVDSQIRFKPLKKTNHSENCLFDPNFTFLFPKSKFFFRPSL